MKLQMDYFKYYNANKKESEKKMLTQYIAMKNSNW